MKSRHPYVAALLLAGSVALAIPGAAQAHRGDGFGAGYGHGPRSEMRGMRALDLTEAQRDQIFKLRHEQAPALRDKMQAARKAGQALREIASAPSYDSARAKELAEAQAKAMSEAALLRAEMNHRVLAVLTPEQRAKLNERRAQRGPRGPR